MILLQVTPVINKKSTKVNSPTVSLWIFSRSVRTVINFWNSPQPCRHATVDGSEIYNHINMYIYIYIWVTLKKIMGYENHINWCNLRIFYHEPSPPHAAALLMFQPGVGLCGRFCLIPGSNRDLHFSGVVWEHPQLYCKVDVGNRIGIYLGGGFEHVFCYSYLGKWSNLTSMFFQMGWFNHQLAYTFQLLVEGMDMSCGKPVLLLWCLEKHKCGVAHPCTMCKRTVHVVTALR